MLAASPDNAALNYALNAIDTEDEEGVHHVDPHVEDKVQEEFHVALTYAICHPNTVMVHSEDAPSASAAVMRPWRLHTVTYLALLSKLVRYVAYFLICQGIYGDNGRFSFKRVAPQSTAFRPELGLPLLHRVCHHQRGPSSLLLLF